MKLNGLRLKLRWAIWRFFTRGKAPPGVTLEMAGELFEEGIGLAKAGKTAEALRIAEQLKGYRYTGAYEVEAVAMSEAGRPDDAIDALRAGLTKKKVWRLGHLLGIYLSDEGRYDEALAALDESLTMHEPEPLCTAYNKAIVFDRIGQTDQAINLLRDAIDGGHGDEDASLQLAESFLAKLSEPPKPPPPPARRIVKQPRRRR